jgi:hypothetical protein
VAATPLRSPSRNAALTWLACLGSALGFVGCGRQLDCDEADQQARQLLAEFGSCASGEACRLVDVTAQLQSANELGICIDDLVCAVALRQDAGQSAFVRRARDVIGRRQCNVCTVAKCRIPETLQAFCDPQSKRCNLR